MVQPTAAAIKTLHEKYVNNNEFNGNGTVKVVNNTKTQTFSQTNDGKSSSTLSSIDVKVEAGGILISSQGRDFYISPKGEYTEMNPRSFSVS